jgi:hypothetical protein
MRLMMGAWRVGRRQWAGRTQRHARQQWSTRSQRQPRSQRRRRCAGRAWCGRQPRCQRREWPQWHVPCVQLRCVLRLDPPPCERHDLAVFACRAALRVHPHLPDPQMDCRLPAALRALHVLRVLQLSRVSAARACPAAERCGVCVQRFGFGVEGQFTLTPGARFLSRLLFALGFTKFFIKCKTAYDNK